MSQGNDLLGRVVSVATIHGLLVFFIAREHHFLRLWLTLPAEKPGLRALRVIERVCGEGLLQLLSRMLADRHNLVLVALLDASLANALITCLEQKLSASGSLEHHALFNSTFLAHIGFQFPIGLLLQKTVVHSKERTKIIISLAAALSTIHLTASSNAAS